jgi:hypothetical protein
LATKRGRAKPGTAAGTKVFGVARNKFHDNVVKKIQLGYRDLSPSGRFLLCDFWPSSSPVEGGLSFAR